MEGWKNKKEKEGVFMKDGNLTEQEMVLELIRAEAEDSLAEVDQPKRKQDNQKAGRKAKRRKLDLLVGWGEADGIGEETSIIEMDEPKEWMEESNPALDKHTQSTLEVRDVLDLSRLFLEDGQREFGGVGSGIVIFVISQGLGQRSREWDTSPWC